MNWSDAFKCCLDEESLHTIYFVLASLGCSVRNLQLEFTLEWQESEREHTQNITSMSSHCILDDDSLSTPHQEGNQICFIAHGHIHSHKFYMPWHIHARIVGMIRIFEFVLATSQVWLLYIAYPCSRLCIAETGHHQRFLICLCPHCRRRSSDIWYSKAFYITEYLQCVPTIALNAKLTHFSTSRKLRDGS